MLAAFKALSQGNHYLQHCQTPPADVCCVALIFLKMQFYLWAIMVIESCGKEPERCSDSWSPRHIEPKINGCWTSSAFWKENMFIALKYWLLDAQSFLKPLSAVLWTVMLNVLSSGANCCTLGECSQIFLVFYIFCNALAVKHFYFNLQSYWTVFAGNGFKDWIQKWLNLI